MGQDERPRSEKASHYDVLAPWYDYLVGGRERALISEAIRLLQPDVGQATLEIGCGTGHGLVQLTRRGEERGRIVGLDLSARMLEVTAERLERKMLGERVELVHADARALPFADGAFDNLFMSFTLEIFSENERQVVLRECRRVLKPQGSMAVVSLSSGQGLSLVDHVYLILHRCFPRFFDCRPIPLRRALSHAGFDVRFQRKASLWGLSVEIVVAKNMCD